MPVSKIKLHQSEKPYVMIYRDVIQLIENPDSLAIWVYLQSKPDNWEVSKTQLKTHFNIGRDRYLQAMRHLRELGLYSYQYIKDDTNKFVKGYYHIYEKPEVQVSVPPENPPDITEEEILKEDKYYLDKNGNQQKEVDIPLKIPDVKDTKFPSGKEKEKESCAKEKETNNSKTIATILESSKIKLQESAEECEYLYGLTIYQLTHPKEFKNSTHKNKKLTRIASDVYTLYRHWHVLGNPEAGMLPETTFKDIAMVNSALKRLNGNLMLFRNVITHWNAFKSSVEAIHSTKVKHPLPDLGVLVKYASVASSGLFLEKVEHTTDAGGDDDGWGFSDEDILSM